MEGNINPKASSYSKPENENKNMVTIGDSTQSG